ncbi:uncharacterized protein KY384_004226 [Bacidia gigantensis]|uniref:uncharacterized protein n=1 Tax=Bacidia gigantensis TaxID=2732470 RepID=UPI001D051DA0|nr:uncharacterized protein KY384_004226 [Bacidia gigantensis]KAG8530869.1 hypothetical protein KY384_004226 [Bacidia gigantensis]
MYITQIVTALALVTLLPSSFAYPYLQRRADAVVITEDQLLKIAPKSKDCTPTDTECSPASKAAGFISSGFKTYNITSPAVAAALVATMALESGEFKYARNKFPAPGKPGQGTRNMQSPDFNKQYLTSIDELKSQVTDDVSKNLDLLVHYGDVDFGSAAWYLTTQDPCKGMTDKLASGKQDTFESYVKDCLGTTSTPDRDGYWTKAVDALGVKPA